MLYSFMMEVDMKRSDFDQKSLVADILSKAFDDNKSVNYVVKQDENRQGRICGLMEYSIGGKPPIMASNITIAI